MEETKTKNVRIIRLIIGVFTIIAFLTLFCNQLTWQIGDPAIKQELMKFMFYDVAFGKTVQKGFATITICFGNPTGLIGYILLALGSVCAFVGAFIQKKKSPTFLYILDMLTNTLLIVGSLLILVQRDAFIASNVGYVDSTIQLSGWPITASVIGFTSSFILLVGLIIDK